MTKHILDRPRRMSKSWLGRAVSIEKGTGPDSASLTLQRRKRLASPKRRVAHFLRIDRQKENRAD